MTFVSALLKQCVRETDAHSCRHLSVGIVIAVLGAACLAIAAADNAAGGEQVPVKLGRCPLCLHAPLKICVHW